MNLTVLKTENERAKESVLEILEIAGEQTREGKIVAVAVAVLRPDGSSNCMWSNTNSAVALAGAVAVLNHRMQMQIHDEAPDNPEGKDAS